MVDFSPHVVLGGVEEGGDGGEGDGGGRVAVGGGGDRHDGHHLGDLGFEFVDLLVFLRQQGWNGEGVVLSMRVKFLVFVTECLW